MTKELINKNLDNDDKKYLNKVKNGIKFIRSYKVKDEKVNWIVQILGPFCKILIDRERIFMCHGEYIVVAR